MNELLLAKGRLTELQETFNHYERKANALMIQIRELLNSSYEFMDLDLETVFLLVKEFRELQLNARECLSHIERIKQTYNL